MGAASAWLEEGAAAAEEAADAWLLCSGSLHEAREGGAPVKTQAKKGSNGPVRHSLAGSARRSRRGQLQRLHCRSVLFLGRRGPRRGLRLSPLHTIFFHSCCCPVTQRVHQRRACSHRTKTRIRFVSIVNPSRVVSLRASPRQLARSLSLSRVVAARPQQAAVISAACRSLPIYAAPEERGSVPAAAILPPTSALFQCSLR